MHVCGIVLAAGAGSRFGGPKALARDRDGTSWVTRAASMLREAGCDEVLVMLGAQFEAAIALVPPTARAIEVADWAEGISATIRAGLAEASVLACDAVVITPVDTPDAPAEAVRRVLGALDSTGLAQAVYDGVPGHPVVITAAHFSSLATVLEGDRGARPYLASHGVVEVECADLWSGTDIDQR